MTPRFRSGASVRFVAGLLLLIGVAVGGPAARADEPPPLDKQRLARAIMTFHSWESKFEWGKMAAEGEAMVPYVAHILADPDPIALRVVERALIFARQHLTKYDCASLVEPTLDHLKNPNWGVRAEAMMLLEKIGGKGECVPVAVLLYAESKYNRIGAAICLEKLGGRRELLALDLWLQDKTRQKDEKFESVKKYRDALRTRLDDEEKKLLARPDAKKAEPPALDKERRAGVVKGLQSPDPKGEWAELAKDGEKVVPYLADVLADTKNTDRVAERAMTFAREHLTKYDCASLVGPTLEHLKNHDWQVRAEALKLLEKIGGKSDCSPVAVMLYAEDKRTRVGAAEVLAKVGGKRELLTLELWVMDETRHKDEAWEAVRKCRNDLRDKVQDEEKKRKAAEKKEK